ncbi:hypothetical protein HOD29_04985 [archaeon]|jgi:hypothetical protein|nr:hypothetical protein [archaeon]
MKKRKRILIMIGIIFIIISLIFLGLRNSVAEEYHSLLNWGSWATFVIGFDLIALKIYLFISEKRMKKRIIKQIN